MDKQREMFEARFPFFDLRTEEEDGELMYIDDLTQGAWLGWQASIAAQQAGQNDLIIALRQARYVLRDLHAKQPDCGLDKLAAACEIAADVMYTAPEPTK